MKQEGCFAGILAVASCPLFVGCESMSAREFEIDEGALLKIVGHKGERLRVRRGEVWVTQYGDPMDYQLKAGESLVLNGEGLTLANARRPSLLELLHREPLDSRDASRAMAGATALLWRMFA
jgi:hypothetical protein